MSLRGLQASSFLSLADDSCPLCTTSCVCSCIKKLTSHTHISFCSLMGISASLVKGQGDLILKCLTLWFVLWWCYIFFTFSVSLKFLYLTLKAKYAVVFLQHRFESKALCSAKSTWILKFLSTTCMFFEIPLGICLICNTYLEYLPFRNIYIFEIFVTRKMKSSYKTI